MYKHVNGDSTKDKKEKSQYQETICSEAEEGNGNKRIHSLLVPTLYVWKNARYLAAVEWGSLIQIETNGFILILCKIQSLVQEIVILWI